MQLTDDLYDDLEEDMEILKQYESEVQKLTNVTFLGRLATYRYLDMHHIIEEALDSAEKFLAKEGQS